MSEKKPKRPRDVSQLAKMMVDVATNELPALEVVAKPNRKNIGGVKGGKARAEKLTSSEKSEIAKNAARTRWEKKTPLVRARKAQV